ncbi:MAG: hypothetical protein ACI89X_000870 [Planctomycetota bacterium]|jgi:hypothetical protein
MASSRNLGTSTGPAGTPAGKPSLFADRRIIILIALVVGIAGWYGYQSWRAGADRDAVRSKLLADTATQLAKDTPDRDELSKLMARLGRQPDSSTSVDLLAPQAEIELVRGRPERAETLFGSIASSPGALPADQRLGSRILLAVHEGFGGNVVEANTMLQQVQSMAEVAYGDSGDVNDLFRAWQASIRLWDPRAAGYATQLQANHGDSPQNRLAQLNEDFKPKRDKQLVDDLLVDFLKAPAELRAMKTIVMLQGGDVPGALKVAEQHVNETPGVQAVRVVAAFVLHACVAGSKADSADETDFIRRRNVHLDWLDKRVPADQEKTWSRMRLPIER